MNARTGLLHGILALLVLMAAPALMPGAATGQSRSESISLTVYNQNFALVKDVRVLSVQRGLQEIRVDDVAATIDPTSVHFQALDHPGDVSVSEQNYQYDLADSDRLLSRFLGREVTAILKEGGTRSGSLLSYDHGSLVLSEDEGAVIVSRSEVRDIVLGEVPGGLVIRPTLVWTLASDREAEERVEISYLANGVNWHAEYVAVVNEDDTGLDMSGWVSLENRSGATYPEARLKLVAGDVNRVKDRVARGTPMAVAENFASAPAFQERGFFEYHIYTLDMRTTVADRETKQLSLFPSASASAEKVLTYEGQRDPTKVAVRMEFDNAADNGLGMALPAGKVRVFKEDEDGALEFVGEDRIDHTPRDEKVRLYLGNAFDVVGERKRSDFRQLGSRSSEESVEIQIRNHKEEAVEVLVLERLRGDWAILDSSHPQTKKDATTIEFPVRVDAGDEVTVTYTARSSW